MLMYIVTYFALFYYPEFLASVDGKDDSCHAHFYQMSKT